MRLGRERLQLKILGCGTSTGVPVLGCSCEVCRSGVVQNLRTRCSALLSYEGKNILIDTAADFRQQALREGIDRVDAVLFTHTHADHLHGIDDLRTYNLVSGEAIPVYGSRQSLDTIRRVFSYIFTDEDEAGWRPRLTPREIKGPFDLLGLNIIPIPLIHGSGQALGYRIGPLAYLTDCSAIPVEADSLLNGIEVLVIDALRFKPHSAHFNISEAIAASQRLGANRTLLTHLSHDVDYHRHSADLPEGIEFAYDGQSLTFELASQALAAAS